MIYTTREGLKIVCNFERPSDDREIFKVNLPITKEDYENGIGEGVWAYCQTEDYKKIRNGARGYFVAKILNDSIYYPNLKYNDPIIIETRESNRPVANIEELTNNYGSPISEKEKEEITNKVIFAHMPIKIMSKDQINNIEFIHHGHDKIEPWRFMKPKNILMFTKPRGGFWASEYTPHKEYRSSWEEFYIHGMPSETVARQNSCEVLFKLKEDSKIILIENLLDLKILHVKYPVKQADEFEGMFSFIDWTFLDWEQMNEDGFDGVYVTEEGIDEVYHHIYGWDIESIVLFNLDCIKDEK